METFIPALFSDSAAEFKATWLKYLAESMASSSDLSKVIDADFVQNAATERLVFKNTE